VREAETSQHRTAPQQVEDLPVAAEAGDGGTVETMDEETRRVDLNSQPQTHREETTMSTRIGKAVRGTVVALAAMVTVAGMVEAADLRSWDQKLDGAAGKRFVILTAFNDEAVLDKETQLVWMRFVNPTDVWTFASGVIVCGDTPRGGRYGFRLPYLHELMSLRDLASGLPAGHPFVSTAPGAGLNAYYLTATTRPEDPTQAFAVNLGPGGNATTPVPKGYYGLPIICVRGHAAQP
jgi:hypothetical protein